MKSGFSSYRDLVLFLVGLIVIGTQIVRTFTHGDADYGVMIFGGTLAGLPLFLPQKPGPPE